MEFMEDNIMTIRNYKSNDTEAVINLWNASLTEDQINGENFYTRIICDTCFDPSLLLIMESEGNTAGFAYGTIDGGGAAYIVAMGVAQAYRRHGIGTALVKQLEWLFVERGAGKISVGPYAANYFFPGVDKDYYADAVAFFDTLGYAESGECCSMDMNLRGYTTPAKYLAKHNALEHDGYRFSAFGMKDCLPLFDFARAEFPYWLPVLRENVLQGRGEETIQLAFDPTGCVVGFAMRAMDGTPGRFGPFGVAANQQGVGLGGVLFHNLIRDMVCRRIFYTWFLWTGGRNLDIYGGWGMKVYRRYSMMGKIL